MQPNKKKILKVFFGNYLKFFKKTKNALFYERLKREVFEPCQQF